MTTHVFQVEIKKIPATHIHGYIAREESSGTEIPLPKGGNGLYVGRYPEVEKYVKDTYGVSIPLIYRGGTGTHESLTLDHDQGIYTWTFVGQQDTVVIKDIPRLAFGLEIQHFGPTTP